MSDADRIKLGKGADEALTAERKTLVNFVNNCQETATTTCTTDIDKTKLAELQTERSRQSTIKQAEQSENWGGSWLKVKEFFDSNKWKQNLCNPEVNVIFNGATDSGSVVSCDGGFCKPVLTMAAEKQLITNASGTNYYIYTITYYVGPVYLNKGTDLRFRVEFRGKGMSVVQGYRNKIILTNGDVKRFAKVFAHVKEFNQMCIVFDDPYPPNIIGNKAEYCRTIKTDDFNTGSPYIQQRKRRTMLLMSLQPCHLRYIQEFKKQTIQEY